MTISNLRFGDIHVLQSGVEQRRKELTDTFYAAYKGPAMTGRPDSETEFLTELTGDPAFERTRTYEMAESNGEKMPEPALLEGDHNPSSNRILAYFTDTNHPDATDFHNLFNATGATSRTNASIEIAQQLMAAAGSRVKYYG